MSKKNFDEPHFEVVKSNEFIQRSCYNLTNEEQKLLCYVISKLKPTDVIFTPFIIKATDFATLFGIANKNVYASFKKMADSFQEKRRWIKIGDNNVHFAVFSESEYNDKQGTIRLVLNSRLHEHLLNLKKNYTQYELWNIVKLKSKYSIRLYELFVSYDYKKNGAATEITFDLKHLIFLLCAESYKQFSHFKSKVLEKAVNEINKFTNYDVTYIPIKEGKSHTVTKIIFDFKPKYVLDMLEIYERDFNQTIC